MSIPKAYKGRYFYHFTHIENIESIVKHDGLLSTNLKKERGIEHHNIANVKIQHRRSTMQVTVEPGGVVHDYVPFYFASVNPMLLGLLDRKLIDQPYICFIAISIERLLEDNVIFTDKSANANIPPCFFKEPTDLYKLTWDLIDSKKWGEKSEEERQLRMAEVLIHREVPLDWIDSFIVFNKIAMREVKKVYKSFGIECPPISYDWFNNRPFFFTKFFWKEREKETLVIGPIQLRQSYLSLVNRIIEEREKIVYESPRFRDVENALLEIEYNFCVIPELSGIYELETDNKVHKETVSEHTLNVVSNVKKTGFYNQLSEKWQNVVLLAAYLHDIGKGPKEKWGNGIQRAYPDHPADAIPMLSRILIEDIEDISDKEVKRVCLLVVYHDLLGDVIGRGRDINEIYGLKLSQTELIMMAALAEADIRAIGGVWAYHINEKLDDLIGEIMR